MKLKNKETGEIEDEDDIRRGYGELLNNTNEFEEFRGNFDKFLNNYYTLIEE